MKLRRRDQRLIFIAAAGVLLALAAFLTLTGLKDSVIYFAAPREVAQKAQPGRVMRIGGLMVPGSLHHEQDGSVRFSVTDNIATVPVHCTDTLPTLAVEGQGVVAEGVYVPGVGFEATRVLAKHDERYMPREVAEALKARGEWKGPQ